MSFNRISDTPAWDEKASFWKYQQQTLKDANFGTKVIGAFDRAIFGGISLGSTSLTNGVLYGAQAAGKLLVIVFTWEIADLANTIAKTIMCFCEVVTVFIRLIYNAEGFIETHQYWFSKDWSPIVAKGTVTIDDLYKITGDLYQNIKTLTSDKNTLQSKCTLLLNETKQLKSDLSSSKTKVGQLETQITNLNSDKKNLENEKNNFNKNKTELTEDNKKINEELNLSKLNVSKLQNEYNALLNKYNELLKNSKENPPKQNEKTEEIKKNEEVVKNKVGEKIEKVDEKTFPNLNNNEEIIEKENDKGMLSSIIKKEPKKVETDIIPYKPGYFGLFTEGFDATTNKDKLTKQINNLTGNKEDWKDSIEEIVTGLLEAAYQTTQEEIENHQNILDFSKDSTTEKNFHLAYYWDGVYVGHSGKQNTTIYKILNEAGINKIDKADMRKVVADFINAGFIKSEQVQKFVNDKLGQITRNNIKLEIADHSWGQPVAIHFKLSEKGGLVIQQKILLQLTVNGEKVGFASELSLIREIDLNRKKPINDCWINLGPWNQTAGFQMPKLDLEHKPYETALKGIINKFKPNYLQTSKKTYEDKQKNNTLLKLEELTLEVLNALLITDTNKEDWSIEKKNFIIKLRAAITSEEFKKCAKGNSTYKVENEAYDLLALIVRARFFNDSMQLTNAQAIFKAFYIGRLKDDKGLYEGNDPSLSEMFKLIDMATATEGVVDYLFKKGDDIYEYAVKYGDYQGAGDCDPYTNYMIKVNDWNVRFIHSGSPTMNSKINPEYKLFIKDVTKEDKKKDNKFFYVNMQNKDDSDSQAIHTLHRKKYKTEENKEDKVNPNFYYIDINPKSAFHQQSQKGMMKIGEFKQLYNDALFDNINGGQSYGFSSQFEGMEQKDFQQEMLDIFDDVNKIFFKDAKELSQEDRKVFVELLDAFLVLLILKETKASYCQISDYKGVDGPGKNHAILVYLINAMIGRNEEEDVKKDWETLVFDSVGLKQRGMAKEERERLLAVIDKFDQILEDEEVVKSLQDENLLKKFGIKSNSCFQIKEDLREGKPTKENPITLRTTSGEEVDFYIGYMRKNNTVIKMSINDRTKECMVTYQGQENKQSTQRYPLVENKN